MGSMINSDLASALVASLSEAAREPNQSSSDLCDSAGSYIRGGGRLFLAADGRRVALFGAVSAPNRVRGKGRGRTEGQLSLSPYGTAPSEMEPKTFDKPLFIFFPTKGKSAFRRANNEITEGLASGGALKCGEHCKALSYEVSRAYKRRFTASWRDKRSTRTARSSESGSGCGSPSGCI